ncbi:MAG: esterase-like activity of phytase family protein, partial [Novosphingobium sp.]|nr:esterase-like activity of phytase family protein [Novosphingobium sp.]
MALAAGMRALKLALLILALVPTAWLRSAQPPPPRDPDIHLVDLMPGLRGSLPATGALRLEGAWQILGRARMLGTLSGLAQTGGGLVAVGDRGGIVRFARPDGPGPWHAQAARLVNLDWNKHHYPTDAEAVMVDPASGDLIVAYEDAPMLERFSPDLARRSRIPLPVLAEWQDNQGPEAMTRLT